MAESGLNNPKKRGRNHDGTGNDELSLDTMGEPSSKRSAHVTFADSHGMSLDTSNAQEEDEFMAFGLGEEMEDEEANARAKARTSGIHSDLINKPLSEIISQDGRKSALRAKSSAAANASAPGGVQLPTVRSSRPTPAVDIDPALNLYNNEDGSNPTMQVTVGPDGRIIINQESQMLQQIATPDVVRTEVEGGSRHITSATYAKRPRGDKWKPEDVEMLYQAIAVCGTDFSMVEVFFPTRTRAQVKARFKKEEKINPVLIEAAIAARKPINVEEFKELIALKKLATADPEAYAAAQLAKQRGYSSSRTATVPQSPAPRTPAPATPAPQTPVPATPTPNVDIPSAYTEDDDTLLAGPAPAPVEEANEPVEETVEIEEQPLETIEVNKQVPEEPSLSSKDDEEDENLFAI